MPTRPRTKINCMPGAVCVPSTTPRRACNRRAWWQSGDQVGGGRAGIGTPGGVCTPIFREMAFCIARSDGRITHPDLCIWRLDSATAMDMALPDARTPGGSILHFIPEDLPGEDWPHRMPAADSVDAAALEAIADF